MLLSVCLFVRGCLRETCSQPFTHDEQHDVVPDDEDDDDAGIAWRCTEMLIPASAVLLLLFRRRERILSIRFVCVCFCAAFFLALSTPLHQPSLVSPPA